ncbi:MAG: Inositol 2-dehydrogenase [Candidatus Hydrogenedentota bacterium]
MSGVSKGAGISRRDFTKAAAIGGFAILSARGAMAQESKVLRAGLIGCGGRGGGAAQNYIAAGGDKVKIVALADVFQDKLEGTRKQLEGSRRTRDHVEITDDRCFVGLDAYKKLVELAEVDVVLHATPPYARPMHIEAAVNAGKHVFTEKPVAVDAPGIRRFIAAAEKAKANNLSFVTGLQRRHQKSYVDTIKQLHEGAIGDIRALRVYWNGNLPFSHERAEGQSDLEYRLRNWYNQIWSCGDNIVEQHVHNIDVGLWVLNEELPVSVVASGGRTWKPIGEERYGDIWDNFSADFAFASGVHMHSYCRHWNDSYNGVFEEATGTKGFSKCMDLGKDDANPYEQEHVDFIASVLGEGPYLNEGVRTANATFAAILARDAAYTGKELKWDEHLASEAKFCNEDTLDFAKAYPIGPIPTPGKPETFAVTVG